MGKFNGDVESLPKGEHKPGAVKFKEFDSPKKLALFMNGIGIILMIPLIIIYIKLTESGITGDNSLLIGAIIGVLLSLPHECLHAICFKGDVYLYTNLKHGSLFVIGTEDMSKKRFIFLGLLPNIVFGFIPFIVFLFFPQLKIIGAIGLVGIPAGIGDYFNVFNSLTQMPKGARTYLHGFNSYWYMPSDEVK